MFLMLTQRHNIAMFLSPSYDIINKHSFVFRSFLAEPIYNNILDKSLWTANKITKECYFHLCVYFINSFLYICRECTHTYIQTYIDTYIYICVCMYVCTYLSIYIYIHTHTHTYIYIVGIYTSYMTMNEKNNQSISTLMDIL